MRFLWPGGGLVEEAFAGILTSPSHRGVPAGIQAGMNWAAENEQYTGKFQPERFFPWLDKMVPYRKLCLFVPAPDIVGDAQGTLILFDEWRKLLSGWPVAFVAQDGQEDFEFPDPDLWSTLFVGGTDDWKTSSAAILVIQQAMRIGKKIHVGRVNWWRRYSHFASLPGSRDWTCDGTRPRFDGTEKTRKAWLGYMARAIQLRLSVPGGDRGS